MVRDNVNATTAMVRDPIGGGFESLLMRLMAGQA